MAGRLTDKKRISNELVRQDKERRLHSLEQDLVAATRAPTIALSMAEVRKKGLLAVLRKHAG
jgi:hypothetical protein